MPSLSCWGLDWIGIGWCSLDIIVGTKTKLNENIKQIEGQRMEIMSIENPFKINSLKK